MTLRRTYVIVLVSVLVFWTFVSISFFNKNEEVFIQKEYQSLNNISNLTTNYIDDFFTGKFHDLATLASFPVIQNLDKKENIFLTKYYLNHSDNVKSITRIDTTGKIIFTVPYKKAIGKDVSFQSHNQFVLKRRIPYVSDVFKTVQGFWSIALAYPVYNSKGKFTGILSILLDYKFLSNKFIVENQNIFNTEQYVVSEDNRILYSEKINEVGIKLNRFNKKNSRFKFLASLNNYEFSNTSFIDSTSGEKPQRYYAVISSIKLPGRDWKLVVLVSHANIIREISNVIKSMYLLVIILILFIFGTSILFFALEKRSQRKLIEQEELFEKVINKTGQLFYNLELSDNSIELIGDVDGLLGFKDVDLFQFNLTNLIRLIHPEDRERFRESHKTFIKQNSESGAMEYRIKNNKGRYLYVEDNFSFIKNKKGEITKRIGVIKDITFKKVAEQELLDYKDRLEKLVEERTRELEILARDLEIELDEKKRREAELEEANRKAEAANKLKSEFLAQMSHEIRTPINTILSHSSLIRMELDERMNEDLELSFHAIENASQRVVRTVELILNMADLQTGSYEAHYAKYDLYKDILKRLSMEMISFAKEKGLDLIVEPPEVDTTSYIDEFSVRHIFSNLIDNAIKYTEKGFVKVDFSRDGNNRLVVSVSDSGIGIKEEYLPHLFEAFSQEMQGYTRKFEGNGLGLALVKKYAIINNIDIQVDTEVGRGTTFHLVFNPIDEKKINNTES